MNMKKSLIVAIVLSAGIIFSAVPCGSVVGAASFPVKLPYATGESFVVVQGYDTPPTHIKKDTYALDFSQNGCQAYGRAAVAAAAGKVMFISQEGYNGGYGTELIIDHGGNVVSRYAHMIPDSIAVGPNDAIKQGDVIGRIGDTGLVAGAACADHPGTHLHFAMDMVNGNGTFTAYDPEPISGYTAMTTGKWYLSDNGVDGNMAVAAIGKVLGAYEATVSTRSDTATTTASTTISITTTAPTAVATTTTIVMSSIPVGGVSVVSVAPPLVLPPVTPSPPSASISTSTDSNTINSTTTDSATSTQDSSSTISIASSTPSDASPPPLVATSSDILFEQTNAGANSPGSWYDDNWFELGNGFAGTLTALTLKGDVNDSLYSASHVSLQEFKDPSYTALTREFTISDDAPFTPAMETTTFGGLSIPLKPYFYYRLSTVQDRQNRSVILSGTASTTVGAVMGDNFIYGTGRVESTSTFFRS